MEHELATHAQEHKDWLVEIVVALVTIGVGVVFWFCRFVLTKITDNRARADDTCRKLALLELKIAEEYVSAATFKEVVNSFKSEAAAHHKEVQDRFAKLESYIITRRGGD
jgi:hypothetical protein|tara:strand:- start:1192 stop:1521 length:330 start_codon:yes stop_codon:yes gene_type:complete